MDSTLLNIGTLNLYHLRMRVGNVFSHVCLSVCLSVQVITFEPLHIETFLICRYIFTISGPSLNIKVFWSRSRSYDKNASFTYFNMLYLCMWLQVINKIKVTHQGKCHIKVKVKIYSLSSNSMSNFTFFNIQNGVIFVCPQRHYIGEYKGGARDMCPPPRSQFFHFHAVFGKIFAK